MDTSFDNSQTTQDLTPSAKLALMHAQAAAAQDQEFKVESVTTLSSGALSGDLSVGEAADNQGDEEEAEEVVEPVREQPAPKKKAGLDLDSEAAFPSLSSSSRPAAVSGWGAGSSARLKQVSPSASAATPHAPAAKKIRNLVTDTLDLAREEQISNQPNKPLGFKSAADSIKQIMSKTGTTINASTSRIGTTTYLIQGKEADVAKAKREILANLAVKVCYVYRDLEYGLKQVLTRCFVSIVERSIGSSFLYSTFHHWRQGCYPQANPEPFRYSYYCS
jgi:hypothetical protein